MILCNNTRKVLVIAAHPDDELLGIGGTIARLAQAGIDATALILGEGLTSRMKERKEADMPTLADFRALCKTAAGLVGYSSVSFSCLPDNRFDECSLLDIIKIIEQEIEYIKPDTVFTHHGHDLNIDHQLAFKAALTATRPLPGCPIKNVFTFETLSSTEWSFPGHSGTFLPNTFVDITTTIDTKIKALQLYKTEMREFPHPRSPEGIISQAKNRGTTIGLEYAEAFQLIRTVS